MPIRIKREDFLQHLQMVQPGLSQKEMIQQSDCFVFHKGLIITYNDEVTCSIPCEVARKFTGAVPAPKLLSILGKIADEELDIEVKEDALVFLGKRKRTTIRKNKDIELPVDTIERPSDEAWKDLPEDFNEAVGMVHTCASKDPSEFALTYVHINPEWLEATDRIQFTRYKITMPLKRPLLVKPNAIQHVTHLGVTEMAVTKSWLHFRNPNGLIFSCRRYIDEYPDLAKSFSMTIKGGKSMTLPKSLELVIDCASVFSSEDKDHPHVRVQVRDKKIRIIGSASDGDHVEWKTVNYFGPSIEFMIHPKLFTDLVKAHNECKITDKVLGVESGKFVYLTAFVTKNESSDEGGE